MELIERDTGPIQAWSNIAYIIAGFITLLNPSGPLVTFCGISLIILGLASGIFHYSGIYPAQKADEVGIYLVLLSTLARLVSFFPALSILIVLCATAYAACYHRKFSSFKTGLVLGSLNIIVAAFLNWQLALAIFIIFLFAALLSWVGRKYIKYNDILHGFWHLFTALALRLLILV